MSGVGGYRLRVAYQVLLFVLIIAAAAANAQVPSPPPRIKNLRATIDSTLQQVGNNPRLKGLSPQDRQKLAEFVQGNMLFTLLHEMGHAVMSEFELSVLGKAEDAANSYASVRLIRIGADFSNEVVENAAKGWFLSDLRDRKAGETIEYYDQHGLDRQRAYQIVCFIVGSNKEKFKYLATETKLPRDRQDTCVEDYTTAARSWDATLKPHLRTPDQPKMQINVIYGEAKGDFALSSQIARSIQLLEIVARSASNILAWPRPITLEMQTCGFPNAAWSAADHKLTLCYELARDFGNLYRTYSNVSLSSRKRKSKTHQPCRLP